MDHDPSDSAVQQKIEQAMLAYLHETQPDWHLAEWVSVAIELGLPQVWQQAKPDAVWRLDNGGVVVAECYARIGALKPGHRRKLAMDAFKLLSLRNAVSTPNLLRCLLIVPEELQRQLQGKGWLPLAIHQAAEVVTVKLTDDQCQQLREAVERQGTGQARTRKAAQGMLT